MMYEEIVDVYEALNKTSKRLEKSEILANFLKKIDKKELRNIVYLLEGRIFPEWDERKIGFSNRLMIKAISVGSGESFSEIENLFREKGDLGLVAEEVFRKKKQSTLLGEKLDSEKILENIRKLASLEGKGSVSKKISFVSELLGNASALEAKYIVKTILENLRIGVSSGIMRDGIAKAFNLDVKEVEGAADLSGDYGEVAELAKNKNLGNMSLRVGRAIKVMLALLADNIDECFEALGKPAIFEVKLDGFRLEGHYNGKEIKLFTRRMEDVSKQFPDVVKNIRKYVIGKSFIIDGEAVGYDNKSGKYLPFQYISQRIKRKYNIGEMAKKLPVEFNVFDILYFNGKNLMNKPLRERREILEGVIREKKRKIILTKKLVTDDKKKAEDFFEEALKKGYEGLMIKNLDSVYKAGRYVKGWMKLKNILEPLDLVIVKALYGEGKRAGWLTSYVVACKSKDKLLEIGKVSTGVKEKAEGMTYMELTKLLKPLIVSKKGKEVEVKPEIVIEVGYEEIQKSPTYSSGYALRFPKVIQVKYRPDKPVSEISSIELVKKIYNSQHGK